MADVADAVQSFAFKGKAPFVDKQRGLDFAGAKRFEDASVRCNGKNNRLEAGQKKPEHEIRCRSQPRNADPRAPERTQIASSLGNEGGSVTASDRHSVRKQKVSVCDRRPSRDRDRNHVRLAGGRQLVERFCVSSLGLEGKPFGVYLACEQRPEHEKIIAVRREGNTNGAGVLRGAKTIGHGGTR